MANNEPTGSGATSSTKQDPPEVVEFQKELYGLFDSRAASASKIDRLTKLAIKSARYYKNIVYCLEKFITRCVPEYKLTGLYVLDSICRAGQTAASAKSAKSGSSSSFSGAEYVGRFEKNIEALFAEFCKVQEDKEKEKVKRVVDLWERTGTFAPTITDNIKEKYFPLLETTPKAKVNTTSSSSSSSLSSSSSTSQAQTQLADPIAPAETTDENAADKAATLISSLAASLAQKSGSIDSPASSAPSSSSSNTPTPSYNSLMTTPATTGSPNNSFLASISDPSSALALQTLLATVSQVKAVTAAASASAPGAGPGHGAGPYQVYSSMAATTSGASAPEQVPLLQQSAYTLPPVLQQLQGVLMNSSQNGAFHPNNNTMVSSTVASPYMHADAQQRGGFLDGNGSAMGGAAGLQSSSSSGPRDPRIDPRLAFQQTRAQDGHTFQVEAQPPKTQPPGQAQPPANQAPMFGAPSAGLNSSSSSFSNAAGFPGLGFDGQAMAQLASLLNPGKNASPMPLHHLPSGSTPIPLPRPPLPFSIPLPTRPQHEGPGLGRSSSPPMENTPIRGHPSLPSRPRVGLEPYPLRNDTNGGGVHSQAGEQSRPGPPRPSPVVKEDPSVSPDEIRVISRTLWVGGTFIPTIAEPDLEAIFAAKGKIATLMVHHAKFNAFIKMADRAQAERCKAELNQTSVQGEVMKVGWGCGFGPRDCFDYTAGSSLIKLDRLTDTDKRWLSSSIVGGFGMNEPIRGGVVIVEPNIEPVNAEGREALPRRGAVGGNRGGRGGGGFGETRGRGRGRGFVSMDHQELLSGGPRGRGRGFDDRLSEQQLQSPQQRQQQQQQQLQPARSHPLPTRPQTNFANQMGSVGGGGILGRHEMGPGTGAEQDVHSKSGSLSMPFYHQEEAQQEYSQGEETIRRAKKTRWE